MNFEEKRLAYHTSIKSMVYNFVLFIIKVLFGALIGSASLISDGVHSLSDIFSTFIVVIGIKLSNKPEDKTHPYGHEKIETVIAFLLGIMLFGIGAGIGYDGLLKIINPVFSPAQDLLLNTGGIIAALLSIIGKEWMYRFTIKTANKVRSSSMRADAWHHRADALSSIGSLIGVIALRIGLPVIDGIACLMIMLFIFKAAWNIVADSFRCMTDRSCPDEIVENIRKAVLDEKDVKSIDVLKTRLFGSKIYVDLEITLDKNLSFQRSHEIASQVHDSVESKFAGVKHCMIHVNPSG
jgi:cation diffusion facilitator family transporter